YVRVLGLDALENGRRRWDLVGWPHAADMVPRVVDALPAHAPAAELVRDRVRTRAGDDQLRGRREWKGRGLVAEKRDRFVSGRAGQILVCLDRRVRLRGVDVRMIEEAELELQRQDPANRG